MEVTKTAVLKGGEFLIKSSAASDTFVPEDFSEEQLMIKDMAEQFIATEVTPILNKIDQLEPGLMEQLLDKAGEQGLLGAAFPEGYGGLGKDFITATLINEALGAGHSFSVAMAAHTGIGSLPILYFGTAEQKQKYIPRLATGELKGAYALTEPNSGSDALSGKTSAKLSDDGKYYLLNGQKCWITNSGFADIFTVFAKIDGEKFTAFIVEKNSPGLSLGEEEHKMGIKGSSTRQIFFQDCKVPVQNVLGEIGKGHLIAFNILNIGRLKLCAAALGGAKKVSTISVEYANQREQFKQPIANFGAIQYKLAEQAIRIYSCESALYRVAELIDKQEKQQVNEGESFEKALLGAAEEYAVECAILKVAGSEVLDYAVDEGVQIHGGNGFSDEYIISKAYRDSRINRIFEGTNEINRLLILDMLLKRAMKGRIDLLSAAMSVQKELVGIPDVSNGEIPVYQQLHKVIGNFKKAVLLVAGAAVQKLSVQLENEQEILMNLADMVIDLYVAESTLLRVEKISGQRDAAFELTILQTFFYDAANRVHKNGQDAIMAFSEGDEQRMLLMGLKRFTKTTPFNTKQARRTIAHQLISANKYCF